MIEPNFCGNFAPYSTRAADVLDDPVLVSWSMVGERQMELLDTDSCSTTIDASDEGWVDR